MDYRAAFEISAVGMSVEKLRVDVTALNLANMHTTAKDEAGLYKPLRVVTRERAQAFEGLLDAQLGAAGAADAAGLGLPQVQIEPTAVAPRYVHEPGHPHADARGMVAYPAVDHTAEMINLVAALRAYEANVAAANATRAMAGRALEIGGGQ